MSPSKPVDDPASFRFIPAERATGPRLLAAIGLALVLWPVSIALVVRVLATGYQIEIALLITAGAFVVALVYLGVATWLASRRRAASPIRSSEDRS